MLREHKDTRDTRVIKVTKGKTELMLVRVPKVMMVHKGHKDIRVIRDTKET